MKFTFISEDTIDDSKTTVEFTAEDINVVLIKMKEFLLGSGYQWIEGDLEFVENTKNDIFLNGDKISLSDYDDSYVLAGSMDDNMSFTLGDMGGAQPTVNISLEDLDKCDHSFVLGDKGLGVKNST